MSAPDDRSAVEIDDNREDSGVRRLPNAPPPPWKFVNDGGMRM